MRALLSADRDSAQHGKRDPHPKFGSHGLHFNPPRACEEEFLYDFARSAFNVCEVRTVSWIDPLPLTALADIIVFFP
jgi:hypothetical protein